MRDRLQPIRGIKSCRRAAAALAGTTLLIGGAAHAEEQTAAAETSEQAATADPQESWQLLADGSASIVVTGERERINTLNSRLGDVQDAPQSISIISKEVIEQQAASSLRDVLRNV